MMCKLLGRGIIQFAGVRAANDGGLVRTSGLYRHFKRDIIKHRSGLKQIWQQWTLTFGRPNAEWLKRLRCYDPRANGRRECLALKRSERLVLPSLDVASGPVVQPDITKDVLVGLGDGNRLAHLRRCTDDRAKLEF